MILLENNHNKPKASVWLLRMLSGYIISGIVAFIIFSIAVPATGNTRKEIKNLRQYVKAANFAKGRELIGKCLKDTTINQQLQLYDLAIALEHKANDAENLKLYLNQKYDTVAFFNSISAMFRYAQMQDSVCLLSKQRGSHVRQWEKQRHRIREQLRPYYPNLYSGGIFFVKNKNYANAMALLAQYISLPQTPLWAGVIRADSIRAPRAAFWYMTSCMKEKRWKEVFTFSKIAEADTANIAIILQDEALALFNIGDTAKYMSALSRGLNESPSPEFFFSRLTDRYNSLGQYGRSLSLCDSMLKTDSLSTLYLYARTIALFNLKDYDECIKNTSVLIEADSALSEAACYMGLCWYNKGLMLDEKLTPDPTSSAYRKKKQEVNAMFSKAMPWLEKYRSLAPQDSARWEAPLYRIYFSLNLSDKLKTIEQ